MSTVSKISFGESSFENKSLSERHRHRPILSGISQMSDEEIIQASIKDADKQAENTKAARALKKWPFMFTAATTIAAGALTKGKLSDKTLSAAKTLAATAAVLALAKPVDNITSAVLNKKDENGEVKKEANPVVEFAVSTAALIGTSALALCAVKKGGNKLAQTFAPAAEKLKNSLNKGADRLDASKLGKLTENISKKTGEFAAKHPNIAEFAKNTGILIPAITTLGGSLILANKVADTREQAAYSNINKLALMREYAKAVLDDTNEDKETKNID